MQFSRAHGAEIADKIREFYGILGLSRSRELRNVLQMVRPVLEKKGYLIVELPFADKEIGALFFARPFWKKMQNFLENSASPNWRKLQRYRSVIFYRPGTSAGIVNCYKV